MNNSAEHGHAKWKIALVCLVFAALIALSVSAFLRVYNSYIDQILYDERLSQMREVTGQLFSSLEDVVENQWDTAAMQVRFMERANVQSMTQAIAFMQEQADICAMTEKDISLVAVDSQGRYYTQEGRKGLLNEMEMLIDMPEQISFVSNEMTTGDARMVYLYQLAQPLELADEGKTVKVIYYGISRSMEALNPYFDCDAYGGNNTVYVLDNNGLRLFTSSSVELLNGYNAYSVLADMSYLHGSSFEATRQKLEETGLAYSNAMLDGVEYYYAFYRMEHAQWTLLFLVPSAYVAVNTVRLVNMTIEIVLVLAVVLVAVVALVIFVMLKRQQKYAIAAERRTNERLAAANERLDRANTELKSAVDAAQTAFKTAEAASRSKSDFLANMSHDIRTPMNAIVGITTLIDHDADSPEKVREYVRKIKGSNEHLLGIINDVLDMSRIESGKTELNVGEFDIRDLIDQVDTAFRPQTDERGQTLEIDAPKFKHPWMMGDHVRLLQILNNVLSNAVKYTPAGGKIRFAVEEREQSSGSFNRLLFRISDNGVGMSGEFLTHIFEPFSREEKSTTNTVQGTGLGMAIVKNLVDRMGGSIHVESRQGQGSTFEIVLNFKIAEHAQEEADAADEKQPQDDASLEGMMFLCAEDNALNAEILTELLHMEGADCRICENGALVVEAFEQAEPGDYDMILMDVQMPVMNGYQATAAIRNGSNPLGRTIPIFAMTANAFSEDIQHSLDAGMNGHISKPVDMNKLKKAIRLFRAGGVSTKVL